MATIGFFHYQFKLSLEAPLQLTALWELSSLGQAKPRPTSPRESAGPRQGRWGWRLQRSLPASAPVIASLFFLRKRISASAALLLNPFVLMDFLGEFCVNYIVSLPYSILYLYILSREDQCTYQRKEKRVKYV